MGVLLPAIAADVLGIAEVEEEDEELGGAFAGVVVGVSAVTAGDFAMPNFLACSAR